MESLPNEEKDTLSDTLRILHLPSYLSNSQREKLLKKYGAVKVKTVNKSDKYATTFANFPSKHAATQAFLRLHQLLVRGRLISVEYAKKNNSEFSEQQQHQPEIPKHEGAKEEDVVVPDFQTFLKKLNSWAFSQVLTQPPPPNIRYKYPSPTTDTLLRISIQMLKEPVFYYQVLHLMNKMNLPPPFQELEPEFPFLRDIYDTERYRNIFGLNVTANGENNKNLEENSESELETDEENELRPKEIVPVKRKRTQSSKRLKIPKFINPSKHASNTCSSSQKLVKPEDVFESLHRGESRTLKITLKADLDLEKRSDSDPAGSATFTPQEEGGFGLIYPVKKPDSDANTDETTSQSPPESITSEELAANRVSINDQRLLPVFKNYHPGKPSCRLYIKNLSKQVEPKDLDFIYKKYKLPDCEDEDSASGYNIRLMQEGRMKGQAFVTLQTVEQAQAALEETNGYILKDKPMSVQFAKIGNKS